MVGLLRDFPLPPYVGRQARQGQSGRPDDSRRYAVREIRAGEKEEGRMAMGWFIEPLCSDRCRCGHAGALQPNDEYLINDREILVRWRRAASCELRTLEHHYIGG